MNCSQSTGRKSRARISKCLLSHSSRCRCCRQIALHIKEIGSGAKTMPQREELLKAARRREVDVIVVWRLDRWGRSLADLVITLKELGDLGVAFVSLTE